MVSGWNNTNANGDTIDRLRSALEHAEVGDLQSFALVGLTKHNGVASIYSFGPNDLLTMVGALEALKLELLGSVDDSDSDIDLPLGGAESEELEQ